MNGLIDFQCEVYESGYEMIYAGEEDEPIEKYKPFVRPIDPKSSKRVFNLMEYPGAYYELANLYFDALSSYDPLRKGFEAKQKHKDIENISAFDDCIIKFANKYGMLSNYLSPLCEEISFWLINMGNMMIGVSSLDMIKTGNKEELEQFFMYEDGKFLNRVNFIINKFSVSVTSVEIPTIGSVEIATIGQTPPRNFTEVAYHNICQIINENLKDSLVTEIIVNKANTGTDMFVRPKDLLSALWLQLAHSVSRNLEFKQCAACSTFFEVKSKKRRFEKIYCSDRCRKRVSAQKRRDKEKAK